MGSKDETSTCTYRASKAVGMPGLIECLEPAITATNDLLTRATLHAEEVLVVLSAIRFTAVQVETLVGNLLPALSTDKMLWMKHLANSFHAWLRKIKQVIQVKRASESP